ncbi:hypothetical protein IM660_03810 [Ruania alkalisoli]|uniref:Uncharacterized protein n=1 Tax=Ruania alkalisoli TaxID=2779775 RepID=A0A7M1SV73_9MICO|nr:hypothetical protein [Ruania alkalisoli]QOR71435.1 hypothetical protein IM660_03810 [Ruania alkalisoli]
MNSASVLESRWHRVLAVYADLVKLCAITALLSLGVVTIPVALATAYDGVRHLVRTGDLPPSGRAVQELWRPATVTGLPPLALGAGAVLIVVRSPSPFLSAAALAIAVITIIVLVRAAATISRSPGATDAAAWQRVLRDLVLYPAQTVLLVLPWAVVALVVVFVPVAMTVPLWCVALSLPPWAGVLTVRWASTLLTTRSTHVLTERSIP